MGKGYKRKTRWRALNIADCPSAPPGDEDDEDGIHKTRENNTRRNGQGVRKSLERPKNEQRDENSGAAAESARSSQPSRSQAKFIFDENEYTRITTPRQDVLFKKGYLGRKKVWTGNNASTSVTPSTTESQSASHSTADGSETMEDQQLYDYRDNGTESYPPNAESTTPMSYGTFYDHASGYYYEYPMMLMGPPMPGPPMHNVMAAMPCQAVPLRPIEWVNPAFVPELDQQYCFVDYQNSQTDQQYPMIVDTNEDVAPTEHANGIEESIENGNGSSSWGESVTSEEQPSNDDEHHSQHDKDESVEIPATENNEAVVMDSDFPNEPQIETMPAQPLHVSHHVLPPVPQPYMYPGHYMFGPALVNVNGLTIQGGQMIRTSEINATISPFTRPKKKKKTRHRKMRRFNGPDNLEGYGLEGEDYSSEAENAKTLMPVTDANIFVPNDITTSRPLNPNCKEFEFKSTNIESSSITSRDGAIIAPTSPTVEDDAKESGPSETTILLNYQESSCKSTSIQDAADSEIESPAVVTNIEYAAEAIPNESHHTNGFCEMHETEIGVDVTCAEFDDIVEKLGENCAKMTLQNNSADLVIVTECDRMSNGSTELRDIVETPRLTNHEYLSKSNAAKNKYNGSARLNHEELPGAQLDHHNTCTSETDVETHINGVPMGVDAIQAQLSVDTSNEDSGFESQTRFSDHPITDAVRQWLRRANSPELFVTTMVVGSGVAETDMEDDELDDGELSKNLQGNPIPALSANSIVNDVEIMSSRTTSSGEFARVSNCSQGDMVKMIKKKKKRSGNSRKRMSKSVDRVAAGEKRMHNKSNCRQQRKKNHVTSKLQQESPTEQQDDDCEFTIKDSDAGMRVATSTRINLNEVQSMMNIESNERIIESSREKTMKGIEVDMNKVKTFEQGEIVVTIDGKLLPTTIYGQIKLTCEDETMPEDQLVNVSERDSIGSIEEPDMLECWEVETVEAVNSKLFVNNRGLYKSDEINDDICSTKVDTTSLELVRKYYTLARGSVQSFSSIEDGVSDTNKLDTQTESKLIIPQRIIETLCGEKISSVDESNDVLYKRLPIDNGIEVYESCYTGQKPPFFITSNFDKSRSLYNEEGPIPCKAACCMIQ